MFKAYAKFVVALITMIVILIANDLALEHYEHYGYIQRAIVWFVFGYNMLSAVINGGKFFGNLFGYEVVVVEK